MSWFESLFLTQNIAQSILLISLTIFIGLLLGRIKVKGIGLGVTWVLFVGIILSHFGFIANNLLLGFIKDFGLILFVYAIGLQVGPSFFSSLKSSGLKLNALSTLVILLGCITTYIIHLVTNTDLSTMVGIMTGATTNTPSLGAAQETLVASGKDASNIPLAYAMAYPLGVMGIIFTPLIVKWIMKIDVAKEESDYLNKDENKGTMRYSVKVTNTQFDGLTLQDIAKHVPFPFVATRLKYADGSIVHINKDTVVHVGDVIRIVFDTKDMDYVLPMFGERIKIDDDYWQTDCESIVAKRIVVTNKSLQGRSIGSLNIGCEYGVTLTTINRAGVKLLANNHLILQMGDRVNVVGSSSEVDKVSCLFGNAMKKLDAPNLIPIFLGIFLGIIVGMIPIKFPNIPVPIKLGLAGGPLIVAILVSRYGPFYRIVTFTTTSANMMIREIGITLFLASVGLSSGANFVQTFVSGGYMWVVYGLIVTVVPLFIVALIARKFLHLPYNSICGLVAGSTTDPPALAFSSENTSTDMPAVAYSTVYPLTMFLRVVAAQIMIVISL